MKFETYTIDGNNSAAVQAAAVNGLVEFKFYKEKINLFMFYNTSNIHYNNIGTFYGGYVSGTYTGDFDFQYSTNTAPLKSSVSTSSLIETGRVEMGPESNQNLTQIDMNFETYPFHTIIYQLKPNSQRTTDIKEIRNYCTGCGYRIRKSNWKFCPKCGLPIKKDIMEFSKK
ncbi:MAG: hypothetical protein HPY57_14065 [Ignavibacteria bacterium]|nr:hypothetical protein [Ignavibacteria bacterium]